MALDETTPNPLPRQAMKAELLDAETELALAYAWRDKQDVEALHRLITAYMRLAISMASKFRRYGAPMNDLIQEAGLGLMKAAEKFDPDRGVRFSTGDHPMAGSALGMTEELRDLGESALVDHGSHEVSKIGDIAYRQAADNGSQAFGDGFPEAERNVSTAGGGAFLAGETEGAPRGSLDGEVEVRLGGDDHWVFAAHLADRRFRVTR